MKKPKYDSYLDWIEDSRKDYEQAKKIEGGLDAVCDAFGWIRPRGQKWTEEMCMESASRFTRACDWHDAEVTAFNASSRIGCYKKCSAHFTKPIRWSRELCVEYASECKTIKEFRTKYNNAYCAAKKYEWIDECNEIIIQNNINE